MYDYTLKEKNEMIDKFFHSKQPLSIIRFPKKQKYKFLCLLWIRDLFDSHQEYSEKEVNKMIKPVYNDYAMVRRYLVDFNLLKRTKDGRVYWVEDPAI
ncbi:MAG TPA: DUF2087 domain-containing protein [Candidatus Izemoplasmatales bacterium]|nr:DUF2087 domain-containing protein [Candidatus Izemoplasmatales bacterium]